MTTKDDRTTQRPTLSVTENEKLFSAEKSNKNVFSTYIIPKPQKKLFYRFHLELSRRNSFAERETLLHELDNPHWQTHLQDDKFPDFTPKFGALRLSKKSSLVDFVYDGFATGGLGLLVSEKALNILQQLRLPPNRAYPLITIQHDKKISAQYYWLQILAVPFTDWIDFPKSEFLLREGFEIEPGSGKKIKIRDTGEFQKIVEDAASDNQELLFPKLVFNSSYHKNEYDLFWLYPLGGLSSSNPIVSDRLRNALEENRLAGYKLKEIQIELM